MASASYGTYGGRSFSVPSRGEGSAQAYYGGDGLPAEGLESPGGAEQPEHSILRSGGFPRGRSRSRISVWELILVPWALLDLILICYLLGGAHGKTTVLWLIPVVLITLSAAFLRHHYKAGNNSEVVLGVLCLTAILIALVVGLYSVFRSLNEFYRLSQGASYFNVLPSEPAAGKMDATTLDFTDTTRVDTQRTFGFVDAQMTMAMTYCVAPVSNGEETGRTRVQFWAAGIDCCESRGNFQCGEANNALAHGGIALPKDLAEARGFQMAVSGAKSAYGLLAADKLVLLKWSKSPVTYRDSLYSSTVTLYLIFGGVYLVISSMIGCALMPVIGGNPQPGK